MTSLKSSLWKFKVIYVYKISRSSDFFPKNHPITKIYFKNDEKGQEVKYFPSKKEIGKYFLESSQGSIRSFENELLPKEKLIYEGNVEEIIESIFGSEASSEIFIETESALEAPWAMLPCHTREFPDFLKTISSRSEIIIQQSDFPEASIPWKYKLPNHTSFIEMDAIGVLGLGYLEELDDYLKEVTLKSL